ncbi:TonB-dependent receptor plug domain protein [Verrucomicrobiia bacterium DG1235]|nr:TonB-dependent receptor plug domain protein [Verrucomicrobiae bacterium DG1235]
MQTTAIESKALARRRSIRIAFALGLIGCAPLAFPQAEQSDEEEDIFELSPFEVTGEDNQGYRATSTLAGTRIRTDLKDVGSAISVYTESFLDDVGATDNGTLLQYATNAEVGGTQGTYSGASAGSELNEESSLINPTTNNRIRGLSAAENTRDFFVSDIPWDSYNVERIDVQRGPNSILFGLGKPAGIVNATIAGAAFENEGEAQIRFGSYGSIRTNVTLNKVLIEDALAVRFSGLMDNQKFQQDPAFEDDERLYLALRWDPKIGGDDSSTSFKVKFEDGKVDANRPRSVTPNDAITAWFRPTSDAFGGMGKWVPTDNYAAWEERGDYPYYTGSGINAQQPYWLFDGGNGENLGVRSGYINVGARNSDGSVRNASQGLEGRGYAEEILSIANFSSTVASDLGLEFSEYGQHKRVSLTDPSVFDFYNTLIDGPNKSEFSDWDALNLDFSQTWFNDRLGVQLIKDKQKFMRGGDSFLGWRPTLTMDISQTRTDLTPNPNFGRPFVTSSGGGDGNSYESERDYNRASVFAEVRAEDFIDSDSFLAKLLGKHRFNGVFSEEDYQTENKSWRRVTHDSDWVAYWNDAPGSSIGTDFRPPVAVTYLGDSIAGLSSASGANIPGIQSNVDIYSSPVYLFDSNWTGGTNYGDEWVPPASLAPIYGTDPLAENSNPANYVGWTTRQLDVWRYDMGADPRLLTGAALSQRETESKALTWQAFLWDGAIVPTLGWREDTVKSRGMVANSVASNRGIRDTSPENYRLPSTYPDDQVFTDTSRSRGVVVHLNQIFNDSLPIDVSVSYNESSNFEVTDVRRDLYGNPIDNPTGETEDIGIAFATKDGRYSFRAVKYESEVKGGSTSLNVGNLGATVREGLKMRNVFLYDLGVYNWESRGQESSRNTWGGNNPEEGEPGHVPDFNGGAYADITPADGRAYEDAAISTWNEIQGWLTDKGFFEAWGFTPVPLQYLTDRSTYEATLDNGSPPNPASQYIPADTSTVTSYGETAPQNFTATADNISKGYEFEFTANPTDNWRIAFNASKTEAINNNVGGPLIEEFVNYMDSKIVGTPAGDMPRWGNPGGAINRSIYQNFRSEYVRMKLQEGTAVPELRKWRYNVVTNYSFTDGKFKGVGVGGSYRWQDKVAIGYPLVPQGNLYGFDVTSPIFGPSEDSIDLWASYGKELTDKIDWKIQLNIRNAFAKEELIPISVQPDNETIAGVRIAPNQEWAITNTFSF